MSNEVRKSETLITIVGASQSGKTTLAAGLAKTSCNDFNVGFADNATRDYLQPRIAGISAGHWPEATSGEDRDICLNINTPGGRSALISFKEYMGERIHDATYLEQIVGKPNGALILLSPGMESLRDPMQREELIGNLKGIVDHLKGNKCVAIAFVVTACDRLKTDLNAFAPSFENYAGEVTNYLNTSGMHWKRFDVTITGELQDQDKPSIAYGKDNTSRDPFVWIMDRVAGKKRMLTAKRLFSCIGVALLAALLLGIGIGSWLWWSEGAKLRTYEKAVAEVEKRISNAISKRSNSVLKSATDDLAGLISLNTNLSCSWESHAKTRQENAEKWSKLYDGNRAKYFLMAMNSRYDQRMTEEGTEDKCKIFDSELENFKPVDTEIKEPLTKKWNELRPKIREAYDVNHGNDLKEKLADLKKSPKEKVLLDEVVTFRKKVSQWETTFDSSGEIKNEVLSEIDSLEKDIHVELDSQMGKALAADVGTMNECAATEATSDALESLKKRITGWAPFTEGGKERQRKLLKDFDEHLLGWERAFSDSRCSEEADRVVKEIHALKPDDQLLEADTVRAALKTAYGFSSRYAHATPEIFGAATNKIGEACETFLGEVLNSFVHKWKPTEGKKPEIDKQDEDFIKGALDVVNPVNPDEKLSVGFLEKLEEARSDSETKWREQQKKKVDEYLAAIKDMSAVDMYGSYRDWYEHNADNPSVNDVDSLVEQTVAKFFDDYIDEIWKTSVIEASMFKSHAGKENAKKQFTQFQKLCLALSRYPCGLKNTWCYRFGKKCKDVGHVEKGMNEAFLRKFHITSIHAQLHVEDRDYRTKKRNLKIWQSRRTCSGDTPDELIATGGFSDEGDHQIGKGVYLETNPWAQQLIGVFGEIVNTFQADDKIGQWFHLSPYEKDYLKTGRFEFSFRQSSGDLVLDWYTCTVNISGVFEGTDIFELYRDSKKER